MGLRRCCVGGGALAFGLVVSGGLAFAQGPPPVDLFVAGTPDTLARLESGVGIAERPIRWVPIAQIDPTEVLRRPSEAEAHVAHAWIDCSQPDRVRIYFASGSSERFLVRDVPLADGWTELALETLAQVIQSSLSALDLDSASGMTRAEMTAVLKIPPPSSPPAPAPTRAWTLAGEAFYAVQGFAPQHLFEQGPGLGARYGQPSGFLRFEGWVAGQYLLPDTVDTPLIGVRLDTATLRGGVGLRHDLSDGAMLVLDVGIGADLVHVSPRQGAVDHATLSPDRFLVDYAARLEVALLVQTGSNLGILFEVFGDVDPSNVHYDVAVDGAPTRVVTPSWIRPGIAAGITLR